MKNALWIVAFALLIVACAAVPGMTVPGLTVPITLQTLGIALAAACLGGARGASAVLVYIAAGLAGAPVFSGGASGLGVLSGASVGYVLSWPFAAMLTGTLVERFYRRNPLPSPLLIVGCILAGSFVCIHPLGIAGMWWRIPGISLAKAVANDLNFWPGDLIKSTVAGFVAIGVHHAFPAFLNPAPAAAPKAR